MVRKQRRLLRDRPHGDVTIGSWLQRRGRRRCVGGHGGGDRRKRRTLDIAGGALRSGGGVRRSRGLVLLGALGKARIVGTQPGGEIGEPVLRLGSSSRSRGGGRRVGQRARYRGLFDAGGDDGNANHAIEAFIEGGADDDVGVLVDFFANPRCGFVDFEQGQIL